jgi:predicted MFS family arabinose efflux permease
VPDHLDAEDVGGAFEELGIGVVIGVLIGSFVLHSNKVTAVLAIIGVVLWVAIGYFWAWSAACQASWVFCRPLACSWRLTPCPSAATFKGLESLLDTDDAPISPPHRHP